MTSGRLRFVAVATVSTLAALALALAGQPASAALTTHTGTGAVSAGRNGGAGAAKPAPADPGTTHRARARALDDDEPSEHTVPNDLLKEQFAEGEEDEGGDEPTLSALCQDYIGKPNPYRDPAPNLDLIKGDTVVPVGSQAGCSSAQNETTIAVNPYNPRNVVAGSNDYRIFNDREQRNDSTGVALTSFDGGRTWKDVVLPHLGYDTGATGALSYMDSAGDPAIAFGPGNTVYYANLVFSRVVPTDGSQQASGLTVSVSHDGGLTWGDPAILQLDGVTAAGAPVPTDVFNDKEWIAADPTSGTVYVTWTRFTYDSDGNYLESPIMSVRSGNFGRTWSGATRVSPTLDRFKGGITPFGSGSNPQVGNDGTLYIAYETSICATADCDAADDHDAVVMATSRDGGRTYRSQEVSSDFDFPETLTGENFRLNSFPQLAYDRLTDRLWITWADDRDGRYSNGSSVKTNGDTFLVGSKHGSAGWSKPVKLGSGTDEWFPAVAAVGNRVVVSYYTRTFDPHGIGVDYAYSAGWGDNLGGLRRITTQTANPQVQFVSTDEDGNVLQGVFIGDYSALAMGIDFVAHPCWTDFRGNPGTTDPNQDVYSQGIPALF
ncbi:sialidase family protein [Rugosimonospora africana]|uniref:Neuraminidase n=1 Tax=Rugosimonospora africana TaxID=556532 RepID=A0A8J3VTL1_9ACTN|nr:sialidase family protein [Rugosimonospora africana]GIH17623.1 neuraminidase [Rugosimonospora africana]